MLRVEDDFQFHATEVMAQGIGCRREVDLSTGFETRDHPERTAVCVAAHDDRFRIRRDGLALALLASGECIVPASQRQQLPIEGMNARVLAAANLFPSKTTGDERFLVLGVWNAIGRAG